MLTCPDAPAHSGFRQRSSFLGENLPKRDTLRPVTRLRRHRPTQQRSEMRFYPSRAADVAPVCRIPSHGPSVRVCDRTVILSGSVPRHAAGCYTVCGIKRYASRLGGRGVCRLGARYRHMGRSQSMFQWLYRLGGLRSGLLGCGYLRVATLVVCFIAICDVAYPADGQVGEGSEQRPAMGQQADREVYRVEDWGKGIYLKPSRGAILVPRGKIQAWERSPSGLFLTKGAQVAEFEEGLELKVLDTRKLASFLADERYYLRVEPADSKNSTVEAAKCLEVPCWVFQGREDADLPENLLPPNVDPEEVP